MNQEVLVRRFATSKQGSRIESCRTTLVARDENLFQLKLQNCAMGSPFSVGDFLELHSDRFDLGVRLTCVCVECSEAGLIIEAHEDLELFYRRKYWRTSVSVWSGLLRQSQAGPELYALWEKAQVLRDDNNLDPSIHVEIMRRPLNLSAGGVRLEMDAPVKVRDSCLLYLCLDDGKPTVCALCEVVWVEEGGDGSTRLCGLRFSNLLEGDLTRIDRYVLKHCRFDPSGAGSPIEKSHSV